MKKLSKKYLALILSVMLIVCSLPLTTVAAAAAPALKISSNVTNGVEDENVILDYMVRINGEAFNGVAKGSDSNDYAVTEGRLSLPYNVTASIDMNDGDSYSVQRLAYSSGKYKEVEASDTQTGTISTTTYYVTVDGEKSEISQSEYNSATDNGSNTSFVIY